MPADRGPEGQFRGHRLRAKFRAENNRDHNFTKKKIASRPAHLEADVERYIDEMARIDRQQKGAPPGGDKITHLARRYGRIRQKITRLNAMDQVLADTPAGRSL